MSLNLKDDGDGPEKRWYGLMRPLFPKYEEFWDVHIVPLTYRVLDRRVNIVRPEIPALLQQFATGHYNVFFRLSLAAEQLQDVDRLRMAPGFQKFYIDLYCACHEMIEVFLSATNNVLNSYGSVKIPDLTARASHWGDPGLRRDRDVLIQELDAYRQHSAHFPVLVTIKGMIPRPNILSISR